MDQWPGKCQIKNFEQLRRMSIVYTWVNGTQPCYRELREKAGGKHAVGGSRDREIGELMYSIRSLEKYVPWHTGQIYIVSPGHIPHWVDMNNPRIKVINQDDLFPDYAKEFLPTFNTHVIEQFLYLIPGLSDIYMQVNDDYLFTKPIAPHEFFTCDGGIRLLHESGLISHTPPHAQEGHLDRLRAQHAAGDGPALGQDGPPLHQARALRVLAPRLRARPPDLRPPALHDAQEQVPRQARHEHAAAAPLLHGGAGQRGAGDPHLLAPRGGDGRLQAHPHAEQQHRQAQADLRPDPGWIHPVQHRGAERRVLGHARGRHGARVPQQVPARAQQL
ncbi:hypothetical protein ON010_g15227 [Phytophthora cinnamomi]|nr:hypothetical protein ON010_g15227 [Phytophthora cinnamomi]